jgi:hypothetical protein
MKCIKSLIIILFMTISLGISGQSEADLKDYFEGSMVQVKIDMPATSQGIDIHPMQANPLNFDDYSKRLKQFGIALYNGDQVMVTKVKVKKKHIEFQLAGGGYGTWGDDSGYVSAPRVAKSAREKELEELIKKENNEKNKKELKKELDDLKNQRNLEQKKLDFEASQTREMKQGRIRELAVQSGSRFNIRYDQKLISGDLRAESIKNALSKYLAFNGDMGAMTQDVDYSENAPDELVKGMLWEDVATMYGVPNNINQKEECGLKIMICTYKKNGKNTEITFVEGVVVSYQIKSN